MARKMAVKKVRFDDGGCYLIKIHHVLHRIFFQNISALKASHRGLINFFLSDRDIWKELEWAVSRKRNYPVAWFLDKERDKVLELVEFQWATGEEDNNDDWKFVRESGTPILRWPLVSGETLDNGTPDEISSKNLLEFLLYISKGAPLFKQKRELYVYRKCTGAPAKPTMGVSTEMVATVKDNQRVICTDGYFEHIAIIRKNEAVALEIIQKLKEDSSIWNVEYFWITLKRLADNLPSYSDPAAVAAYFYSANIRCRLDGIGHGMIITDSGFCSDDTELERAYRKCRNLMDENKPIPLIVWLPEGYMEDVYFSNAYDEEGRD